ncbi:MAG: ECF transporter S component [Candidatus Faecousia sp.]|nr:ECF transporter S component [Candidatus Faecousia sp.]
MKTTSTNVGRLTKLALLVAIELAMRALGLGAVPVGPLYMSFLTLPIAIGAMLCGPVEGLILGAVFGILSLTDAISGRSAMTGTFFSLSPVHTVVLCVGMRMLMGLCCGYVYKLCKKADKSGTWSYFVGAVSAPLLNTLFFMGYIVLVFYPSDYVQALVTKLGAANPVMFVVLLVGVQGLVEAAVCGILGGILGKTLDRVLKK